jgi:hypothetical protein
MGPGTDSSGMGFTPGDIPGILLRLLDYPAKLVEENYRPQDITPEQMKRFYEGPMSAPGQAAEPDAQRFRERLAQVMNESAVIRDGDDWRTPREYIGSDDYFNAVLDILGGQPGEYTEDQKALAEAVVQAAVGSFSAGYMDDREGLPFTAVNQSEYDSWSNRHGLNARYMLTPEGADVQQKIADVNIMRALQSGELAPPYAQPSTAGIRGGLSFLRNTFAPFGDWTGQDEVDMKGGSGFAGQADPAGRIREAMYWDDRLRKEMQDAGDEMRRPKYKDSLAGANLPQYSSATLGALPGNMLGGEGIYAQINRPFQFFFQNPLELTPEERARQAEIAYRTDRVTPVIPDGADPKDWERARNLVWQHRMGNENWAAAQAPRIMNAMGLEGQYLSPAADSLVNLPRYWAEDAPTMAFASLAGLPVLEGLVKEGPKSLVRTAPRYAGHLAADIKSEALPEMAMEGALNADSGTVSGLFEPRKENYWMGEGVSANDPNYEKKYQQRYTDRANEREEMKYLTQGRIDRPFASASWEQPNNAANALGSLLTPPPSQQEQEYLSWSESQPNKPPQPPKTSIIGPNRPMIQARW